MTRQTKEEVVGDAIRDGRHDVARAIVQTVLGRWEDQPPYTDLAREIVDDPYYGVELVWSEMEAKDRPMDLHGLDAIERVLRSVVSGATYNEGQGPAANMAEQHYLIALSLVEQAICHLKIARSSEEAKP